MTATRPDIPMNQSIASFTIVFGSTQAFSLAKQFVKSPRVVRVARMVPIIRLADMTIARPMKAWVKVFLPAAAFPGSPAEKI